MRLPALHRLGRALVIVALILSLGAHWALLQSIAWAGMLYTYSQQTSFTQAVAMTFDGDHPCSLCKRIQKGRSQERHTHPKCRHPASAEQAATRLSALSTFSARSHASAGMRPTGPSAAACIPRP